MSSVPSSRSSVCTSSSSLASWAAASTSSSSSSLTSASAAFLPFLPADLGAAFLAAAALPLAPLPLLEGAAGSSDSSSSLFTSSFLLLALAGVFLGAGVGFLAEALPLVAGASGSAATSSFTFCFLAVLVLAFCSASSASRLTPPLTAGVFFTAALLPLGGMVWAAFSDGDLDRPHQHQVGGAKFGLTGPSCCQLKDYHLGRYGALCQEPGQTPRF
mmetsp:Transcript_25574/g.64883  ORF Transcript_25574/g.64883 Transcript_25574/m.64883 type:complete len:216 (-) Transcript_25574:62-709(-)